MILYRFHSVLGPPLQSLQSRLQSADLIMTGGKNLYKHNPQMLIFISLINIKIPRSQCKDRQLPHCGDTASLCTIPTLLCCAVCRQVYLCAGSRLHSSAAAAALPLVTAAIGEPFLEPRPVSAPRQHGSRSFRE